ncbi:hypothetical protein [Bradyrhizobium sediminis]|nr:hypothetical protein [Bradyrhizobium sediminis]
MSTAGRFIDFGPIEFRDDPFGSTDRGLSDNRPVVAIAIKR